MSTVHSYSPLPEAPERVVGADGTPHFGTFAGTIPTIDLRQLSGRGLRAAAHRIAKLKRWQYAIIVTPELLVGLAMVDIQYAANAFVFAAERATAENGGLVFDRGFLGLPRWSVEVGDRPSAGGRARFRLPRVELAFDGDASGYDLRVRIGAEFSVEARLEAGPTPLTLVAPVPGGVVNVTQKLALLTTRGTARCGGREFGLDGGFAGLDYTHGLLARQTAWRWAFGMGRSAEGAAVGFNLVEGFNSGGAGEDALWVDGELELLPPCAFEFDRIATTRPWRIRSADGRVDLEFRAWGEHREERELGVASSRFIQVAGEFTGRIVTRSGRELTLTRLAGVTEDQAVKW